MTFEEALKKMKDGYEVGLEGPLDSEIYRIINGEILHLTKNGWIPALFDSKELLSTDWYERR